MLMQVQKRSYKSIYNRMSRGRIDNYVQVPLLSSTLGNGSIINDLDISVGHSKSQRQCTLHPISKYVFYTALSTSVELFVFCFFGF